MLSYKGFKGVLKQRGRQGEKVIFCTFSRSFENKLGIVFVPEEAHSTVFSAHKFNDIKKQNLTVSWQKYQFSGFFLIYWSNVGPPSWSYLPLARQKYPFVFLSQNAVLLGFPLFKTKINCVCDETWRNEPLFNIAPHRYKNQI